MASNMWGGYGGLGESISGSLKSAGQSFGKRIGGLFNSPTGGNGAGGGGGWYPGKHLGGLLGRLTGRDPFAQESVEYGGEYGYEGPAGGPEINWPQQGENEYLDPEGESAEAVGGYSDESGTYDAQGNPITGVNQQKLTPGPGVNGGSSFDEINGKIGTNVFTGLQMGNGSGQDGNNLGMNSPWAKAQYGDMFGKGGPEEGGFSTAEDQFGQVDSNLGMGSPWAQAQYGGGQNAHSVFNNFIPPNRLSGILGTASNFQKPNLRGSFANPTSRFAR